MAGKQSEIKIQFKVESAEFKQGIDEIKSESAKLNKEFNLTKEQMKLNATESEKLATQMDFLGKKEALAAKEIRLTEEHLDRAKASFGENSTEVKVLENKLLDTKIAYEKIGNQITVTSEKLDDAQNKWKNGAKGAEEFGKGAEAAGKKLAPVSAAAGGAIAALVGVAVKAGASADDINTLAKVTGLSTDEIQRFQFASDQIDVSMDTLTGSMSKLTKNMSAAKEGSQGMTLTLAEQEKQAIAIEKAQNKYNDAVKKHGKNSLEARDANLKLKDVQDTTPAALSGVAAAFDKLGVSVTDSQGNLRDNEAVFQDTIKALGGVANETERDALAMEIFGKSAQELNPLILGGADALREIGDAAAAKGLILTQEELDTANALNDTLDQMKAETMAGLMQLGSDLAPVLIPLFKALSEGISGLIGWFQGLDSGSLTLILTFLGIVASVAPLLIFIGKLATGISGIMTLMGSLGPVFAAITGPVGIAIAVIVGLIAIGILLYKNWGTIMAKAKELFSSVSGTFASIKEGITGAINGARDAVGKAIERIKSFFNFSWSLPKLKMPTFSVTGKFSLNPPQIPKLGIRWNADGGIFTKPTVLNTSQGLQGFGEAGDEAILPISKLAGILADLLRRIMPEQYAEGTGKGITITHEIGGNFNINFTGNGAAYMDNDAVRDQVLEMVLNDLDMGNRATPNRTGLIPISY